MKKWTHVLVILQLTGLCAFAPLVSQAQQKLNQDSHDFIIGGQNVHVDDAIAAVTVALTNTDSGALCTATLLSESIAVTAAHCVEGRVEDMRLVFGVKLKGEVKRVQRVATPSNWLEHQDNEKNTGDIAILKFTGGIPESAAAADLLSSHEFLNGESVTLAGFGISKAATQKGHGILRWVEVRIEDAHYSSTEILLDQTDRKGACHGDSGGPAFIQESSGELRLWGVTSRGVEDPSDLCIGQSVYTRIEPYMAWIEQTIKTWN